jgi:hypothetical protein
MVQVEVSVRLSFTDVFDALIEEDQHWFAIAGSPASSLLVMATLGRT